MPWTALPLPSESNTEALGQICRWAPLAHSSACWYWEAGGSSSSLLFLAPSFCLLPVFPLPSLLSVQQRRPISASIGVPLAPRRVRLAGWVVGDVRLRRTQKSWFRFRTCFSSPPHSLQVDVLGHIVFSAWRAKEVAAKTPFARYGSKVV